MLDYSLIDKNTSCIKESLNNSVKILDNFYTLKDVFDQAATEKLKFYIDTVKKRDWSNEQGQEQKNRAKLTFKADTVLEEFHIAMENSTNIIQNMYPELNLKFDGVMIWLDRVGYNIVPHTDNPKIAVSVQIYLYDTAPHHCGTRFYFNDNQVDVLYQHNTGYLIEQVSNKLMHGSMCKTPKGVTRYSLYAVWIQES